MELSNISHQGCVDKAVRSLGASRLGRGLRAAGSASAVFCPSCHPPPLPLCCGSGSTAGITTSGTYLTPSHTRGLQLTGSKGARQFELAGCTLDNRLVEAGRAS